MNRNNCSIDEYIERVLSFHGFAAPGVIAGKFMVDLAYQNLPEEGLFDAICETDRCLPDAIQLLTPCTIGNGWLKVFNFGRFALILYDKNSGEGVRVYLYPEALDQWPEIKTWFFKLKPKREQDSQALLDQIKQAGTSIFHVQKVKINPGFINKLRRKKFAICPVCHEAYPASDGEMCLCCRDKTSYMQDNAIS